MAEIAYLECARCGSKVSAEALPGVCPVDAGMLYVRYDMDTLRETARRERPAELAAAALRERGTSLGMWRYADVLPTAPPVMLGEGWTPLLPSRRYPGLFVKEEGGNPTGSAQARGMALAITMAKHYGQKHLAIASEGDAAAALAAYAAAAKLPAHIFMPEDVGFASYVAGVLYGAAVTIVDGLIPACERRLAETIRNQKEQFQKESGLGAEDVWFDVSTLKEPYRVEGTKTMGYELVEQLGWKYPDAVLYPAGGGVGLIGVWKAFEEMEQLGWVSGKRPRIYALQSAADTPMARAYDEGILLEIVRASGGSMVASTGEEIMASLREWATEEGLCLCPEGAAATAGYDKLRASGEIKPGERVVLFNTGAGLKYVDAVAKALHLRRPEALPTSLPVGGIITPV